jgi:hypothetical protein
MSEAKYGEEFIRHELDEAIAFQQTIVDAERELSSKHPFVAGRESIKACLKDDQAFLKQLQQLGKPYGATGKVEDVVAAMKELMTETTSSAGEAESEAYEAHAVLLTLKRKQQDSAGAMLKIARALKDTEMRDAAREFGRAQQQGSKILAASLADFAVEIATQESPAA